MWRGVGDETRCHVLKQGLRSDKCFPHVYLHTSSMCRDSRVIEHVRSIILTITSCWLYNQPFLWSRSSFENGICRTLVTHSSMSFSSSTAFDVWATVLWHNVPRRWNPTTGPPRTRRFLATVHDHVVILQVWPTATRHGRQSKLCLQRSVGGGWVWKFRRHGGLTGGLLVVRP